MSALPKAELRRCHACGGVMVFDEDRRVGPVVIATSFACEGCASVTLVLSPVGQGGLLGIAGFSVIASAYFLVGKQENGWVGAVFSLALAAFFGFLWYLRFRDARRNPPIA